MTRIRDNIYIISARMLLFLLLTTERWRDAQSVIVTCTINGKVTQQCNDTRVCPGTLVTVTSTNNRQLGNNYWAFPGLTCLPIKLIQGAGQSCGSSTGSCGQFTATNGPPNNQSGLCLTSILTYTSYTSTNIITGETDYNDASMNTTTIVIQTEEVPRPPNCTLYSTNETSSVTINCTTSITGGSPINYNISYNGSTPQLFNGSYVTFSGLSSNTLYCFSIAAVNCAGNSDTVTACNYTLATSPSALGAWLVKDQGTSLSLKISWNGVGGVNLYILDVMGAHDHQYRRALCLNLTCFWIVGFNILSKETVKFCIASVNANNLIGPQSCNSTEVEPVPSSSLPLTLPSTTLIPVLFCLVISASLVPRYITVGDGLHHPYILEGGLWKIS